MDYKSQINILEPSTILWIWMNRTKIGLKPKKNIEKTTTTKRQKIKKCRKIRG